MPDVSGSTQKLENGAILRHRDDIQTGSAVAYWWLNANPNIWEFENKPVGKKETYSSYNEKGNKRKIYKWFLEVKPGDLVVGYVTVPQQEVVAICKITKGLHQTSHGEEIEFEKIEQLARPVAYKTLQASLDLENCEPLLNNQGSLHKLTEREFKVIYSLASGDSTISDIEKVKSDKTISKTTARSLIDARIGQGKYGWNVREVWKHQCAVTGSITKQALEASHIKRWADSNNKERLDPNNGLLLTANMHKLFDAGLISFADSGKMLVSSKLPHLEQTIFGIIGQKLSQKPSAKTAKYLSHHRRKFKMNLLS